jgi:hypothetical protein
MSTAPLPNWPWCGHFELTAGALYELAEADVVYFLIQSRRYIAESNLPKLVNGAN